MTKKVFRLMMAAVALLPMTSMAADSTCCWKNGPRPEVRSVLFTRGDMGSTFWRIPALVTTNDGVVIAAADKRNNSNGDLPNLIDVVVRRSTDAGETWGDFQMVLKADSVGGYGDPALGVHRPTGTVVIVAAHGNGLWQATPEEQQYVVVTRSTDDGKTWSEPINITPQLYDPVEGVAPLKASAGFASSGTLMCDDNGRLWFVLVARTKETKWGPLQCYVCYSDDAGLTWTLNPNCVDDNGDESKIAQLSDGSYYVSIRNRDKGARKVTRSADGTGEWQPLQLQSELVDPACNGDLISLTPAQVEDLGLTEKVGQNGLLIHSLANDPKERKNVSIFTSIDDGLTWVKNYIITPGGSSYSALTMLPDGKLGCLSEENAAEGGFKLWFTKINLDDILGN